MFSRRGIERKTPDQLATMRRAGVVVASTLALVRERARPGMTTGDLDRLAAEHIRDSGAVPSFLGYHGFPATICVSVGAEVVHGIPGSRVLRDDDVVSVDCGAIVDGWHGDAATTFVLGTPSPAVARLLEVCEAALWAGLAAARPGARVGDVSAAVEAAARRDPAVSIVEDYVGHGIGSQMHQPPDVPNQGGAGRGPRLVPGMALAVEPMLTLGGAQSVVLDDDWTVVTRDGSVAAHFEHTVAVTAEGPRVLTALDEGAGLLVGPG